MGAISWLSVRAQSPLTAIVAKNGELAPELDLIPRDAGLFVSIRVADLWDNEVVQPLRDLLAKDQARGMIELEKMTSLRPEHVERITLLAPSIGPDMGPPIVIVTTIKPYDRAKLLTALHASDPRQFHQGLKGPSAERFDPVPKIDTPMKSELKFEKECGAVADDDSKTGDKFKDLTAVNLNAPYYALGDSESALILIDERTFVVLPVAGGRETVSLLAQFMRRKEKGELTDALNAAGNHHITIGLSPASLLAEVPDDLPVLFLPLKSLFKTESATITIDFGTTSKLAIDLKLTDDAAATKASKAIDAFRTIATEMLPGVRKQLVRASNDLMFMKTFDLFEKALNDATVEVKADRVSIRAEMKLDVALTVAVAEATRRIQEAAARMATQNNLKQMGIAMHSYHEVNGILPPTNEPQQPNKFPVSWRVLILPYIEQDNLYRMYRFDEPWDSENNKKLIPLMPKVYEVKGHPAKEKGKTFFQVFTGPNAMFVPGRRNNIAAIQDGTSNTFMIVEAGEAVVWTQPVDLVYDAKKPVPKLGGHFKGGFIVGMGDGSVRFVRDTMKEENLRALITANGGEVVTEE